jgi:hypothetical protein
MHITGQYTCLVLLPRLFKAHEWSQRRSKRRLQLTQRITQLRSFIEILHTAHQHDGITEETHESMLCNLCNANLEQEVGCISLYHHLQWRNSEQKIISSKE